MPDTAAIVAALTNENFDLRREVASLKERLGVGPRPKGRLRAPEGITMTFDEKLEAQIMTPHSGERVGDPPLWLIWLMDEDEAALGMPNLAGIATSEVNARILTGMAVDRLTRSKEYRWEGGLDYGVFKHVGRIEVERTCGDHYYASRVNLEGRARVVFENKPVRLTSYGPRGYTREGD